MMHKQTLALAETKRRADSFCSHLSIDRAFIVPGNIKNLTLILLFLQSFNENTPVSFAFVLGHCRVLVFRHLPNATMFSLQMLQGKASIQTNYFL